MPYLYLTLLTGKIIRFRESCIESYLSAENSLEDSSGSVICLSGYDGNYVVQETPEQIDEMLKKFGGTFLTALESPSGELKVPKF